MNFNRIEPDTKWKAALSMAGAWLGGVMVAAAADAPTGEKEFVRTVKPFLEQHCYSCHGADKQKGDLRLDTLGRDFNASGVANHWMEVMERINSGEMPPKKEPRPKVDARLPSQD